MKLNAGFQQLRHDWSLLGAIPRNPLGQCAFALLLFCNKLGVRLQSGGQFSCSYRGLSLCHFGVPSLLVSLDVRIHF
jgi:hypothetical protein